MQKIIVTGGAGFIGSNLSKKLLSHGIKVTVLDDLSSGKRENVPPGADFVMGSILDHALVIDLLRDADACIHLAAIASVALCNERYLQSHTVNLTGALTIFDAARRAPKAVKVVYASSAAAYGARQDFPLREDMLVAPLSPYGADKYGCELHARAAHEVYGLNSVGFRFFNVYGRGQDPTSPYSGVISKFIERIRTKADLLIFGDGEQTRDFVYVDDVVEALMRGVMTPIPGAHAFNVCTGVERSINDLARILIDLDGSALKVRYEEARSGEVRRSVGDTSRLTEVLGFQPSTPLEVGLLALLNSEDGE